MRLIAATAGAALGLLAARSVIRYADRRRRGTRVRSLAEWLEDFDALLEANADRRYADELDREHARLLADEQRNRAGYDC